MGERVKWFGYDILGYVPKGVPMGYVSKRAKATGVGLSGHIANSILLSSCKNNPTILQNVLQSIKHFHIGWLLSRFTTFYRLGAPHCEQGQRQPQGLCGPLVCFGGELERLPTSRIHRLDSGPTCLLHEVQCRGYPAAQKRPTWGQVGGLSLSICKRWEVGLY